MEKLSIIIFNITVLLLLFTDSVFSGNYKMEREWLMAPPSARGAALGGGLSAVIDNSNTVFWNPGGVTFLEGFNISHSHSPYILTSSGEEYEMYNFAFNTNLGKSFVVGLNLQHYQNSYKYDGFYHRDRILNHYQDSMTGFLFGYKRGNIGMGINTKFLLSTSSVFAVKDLPVVLDIGALYSRDFVLKHIHPINVNTGLSILNISNGIKYERTAAPGHTESLPIVMRVGYSATIKPVQKAGKLTPLSITHNLEYSIVINADKSYDKFVDCQSLGLGLEVVTYEFLFSRIGYHFRKSEKDYNNNLYNGITYGVGLNVPLYYFFKLLPISIRYDYGTFPWDTQSIYKRSNYTKIHSLNFTYTF